MSEVKTLTITNLGGPLVQRRTGDIDSGMARYSTSWGYNPYIKPGNLTWVEQPTSILTLTPSTSSTTSIYYMKDRVEAGFSYVYAVGGDKKVYRILMADTSPSPNKDTTSVISSVAGSPFYNGGMVFYGGTEKIFIGTNTSIERVNFDGSNHSVVATAIANNTPRPMATFQGKIYFGNFNNIGEIDSTETMVTANKLSPALPAGLYTSDLDTTPDGNYLQITASRTTPAVMLEGASSDPQRTPSDAYKFFWNGIDTGVTAFEQFRGMTFSASEVFGSFNYVVGRDIAGGAIFDGSEKVSLPTINDVFASATYSIGNVLGVGVPEYDVDTDRSKFSLFHYGKFDQDSPKGLYRLLFSSAAIRNDVHRVTAVLPVSNFGYAPQSRGATDNISAVGKFYYATSEVDDVVEDQMTHLLWRFSLFPVGTGSVVAGVYETQTQLFSKKIAPKEVRLYTEPLVNGNDFVVDLIGSGGSVISGGSQRFIVAASSIVAGTDMVHFNPQTAPTYALGVRITNSSVTGVVNWTATKIEIDYNAGGK